MPSTSKPKPKPNSPTKISLQSSKYTLIGLAIFATLSISSALLFAQPTPLSRSQPIDSSEDFTVYDQTFNFIYAQPIRQLNQAQITFPFKILSELTVLFVGYSQEGATVEVLAYHPSLISLNWPTISGTNLYLYQKNPTYSSIGEFIANPPSNLQIAVDPKLPLEYPQFSSATPLNSPINLDQIDYILTTFIPPLPSQDYYLFQREFEIRDPKLNDLGQIEWFIRKPQQTEFASYAAGGIQIEFF